MILLTLQNRGAFAFTLTELPVSDCFHVLEVDRDYVKMSELIENKLNCKFEDGCAFYQFSKKFNEDLLYLKQAVWVKGSKVRLNYLKETF